MDRRHLPLLIGLSIPVLMILFVAGAVYVPSLFAEPPRYDFVFSMDDSSYGGTRIEYRVRGGKLVRREIPEPQKREPPVPPVEPQIYHYDVKKDEAQEISLEEAEMLKLSDHAVSLDGYEIVQGGGRGGFFPFDGGGDWNAHYLKGQRTSKKLNIPRRGEPYSHTFQFIGWIIP